MKTKYYEYKGKTYQKLYNTKIKIADEWINGVAYKACYDLDNLPNDTVFVRTTKDFDSKFIAVHRFTSIKITQINKE